MDAERHFASGTLAAFDTLVSVEEVEHGKVISKARHVVNESTNHIKSCQFVMSHTHTVLYIPSY